MVTCVRYCWCTTLIKKQFHVINWWALKSFFLKTLQTFEHRKQVSTHSPRRRVICRKWSPLNWKSTDPTKHFLISNCRIHLRAETMSRGARGGWAANFVTDPFDGIAMPQGPPSRTPAHTLARPPTLYFYIEISSRRRDARRRCRL